MPRGSKAKYTKKQDRQAEHIEEGYEKRGVPKKIAKARAWATVNKETGGGKKSGSGRGKKVNLASSKKGGKLGGAASANRSASAKSASAKKAAATRKRNAGSPKTTPKTTARTAAKKAVKKSVKKTAAKRQTRKSTKK